MPDRFEFEGITFPSDGSVIDDLNLSVGVSESVALFGPNGGGKSSIVRVIAGTTNGSEPLIEAAYLPQTPHMFRGTVAMNLLLGLDNNEAREAKTLVSALEVAHLLQKRSDEISVGEAQRICLARTLASSAPLVLLDEPLAPINAASRLLIVDVIQEWTRHRALLWASHSLEAVRALADRLIVLDDGIVLQDGSIDEVLNAPATARVLDILGLP